MEREGRREERRGSWFEPRVLQTLVGGGPGGREEGHHWSQECCECSCFFHLPMVLLRQHVPQTPEREGGGRGVKEMYTNSTRHTDCIPSCTINLLMQKLSTCWKLPSGSIANTAVQHRIRKGWYTLFPYPRPVPWTLYPVPRTRVWDCECASVLPSCWSILWSSDPRGQCGLEWVPAAQWRVLCGLQGKHDTTFYTFRRQKFVRFSNCEIIPLHCVSRMYACIIKKNLPILIYLEQTLNQTHYYIITIIPPFPWFLRAKTSIICTWAYAHSKTENSRQCFVILEVLLVGGAREWTLTFVSVVVLSRVRFKQIVTSCQFKCLHVWDRELAIEMLRSMRRWPWTVHIYS